MEDCLQKVIPPFVFQKKLIFGDEASVPAVCLISLLILVSFGDGHVVIPLQPQFCCIFANSKKIMFKMCG